MFLFSRCTENMNVIKLPKNNKEKVIGIYFENDSVGYLICTKKQKEYDCRTNIKKTINGGKSWLTVQTDNSIEVITNVDEFYSEKIGKKIFYSYWDTEFYNIVMYDLRKNMLKKIKFKDVILNVWEQNGLLGVSSYYGTNSKIRYYDEELNLISTQFKDFLIYDYTRLKSEYFVFADLEHASKFDYSFGKIIDKKLKRTNLSLNVKAIQKLDSANLLLIAVAKNNNSINLLNYNELKASFRTIKTFPKFNKVLKVLENKNVIVFVIREMIGGSQEIIYSLNMGKTWLSKSIDNLSRCSPYCLVNDELFIMGSTSEIVKIKLKNK